MPRPRFRPTLASSRCCDLATIGTRRSVGPGIRETSEADEANGAVRATDRHGGLVRRARRRVGCGGVVPTDRNRRSGAWMARGCRGVPTPAPLGAVGAETAPRPESRRAPAARRHPAPVALAASDTGTRDTPGVGVAPDTARVPPHQRAQGADDGQAPDDGLLSCRHPTSAPSVPRPTLTFHGV